MMIKDFSVVVLSLRDDLERREAFRGKFENISYEFFDGVLGSGLSESEYSSVISGARGRALKRTPSPAEVGCFLSHKAIISRFVDSGAERLLVLEDDVSPLGVISPDVDIAIARDRVSILGGQEGLKRPALLDLLFFKKSRYVVPKMFSSFLYRTCCYALDREVGLKIANSFSKNCYLADDWMSVVNGAQLDGLLFDRHFSHPLDLSLSHIEHDRQSGTGNRWFR